MAQTTRPRFASSNVGIAIGEGSTSAARAAADIVLTDERIETLVLAVVEGRAMWASVRDAVSILIGGNLGEIGFTLGAGLVDGRPPLNARQLLLVNLLTDVAPAMAIALRPPSVATHAVPGARGARGFAGQSAQPRHRGARGGHQRGRRHGLGDRALHRHARERQHDRSLGAGRLAARANAGLRVASVGRSW